MGKTKASPGHIFKVADSWKSRPRGSSTACESQKTSVCVGISQRMGHSPLVSPRKLSEGHEGHRCGLGEPESTSASAPGEKPSLPLLPCMQTPPALTALPLDLRATLFWTSPQPPHPSLNLNKKEKERERGPLVPLLILLLREGVMQGNRQALS